MVDARKLAAEGIGTFWLTFGGCGSAVIAAGFPQVGIGLLGVSLAFGLTVVTMAYAIGHISGCHLNPAVTVGLAAGGRFPAGQIVSYVVAQVVGARRRRALCDRQRRARLQPRRWLRRQRLWRAFARQLRPCRLPDCRGSVDHDVPVHHHGCDPRQGAGGLRTARHRPWAYAHSPDQHSDHQYLGQSGPQHRGRRCSSAAGRSASSGCSGWHRWSAERRVACSTAG